MRKGRQGGEGRADTRMNSRIARAGVIAAEAVGIVVAAAVALAAFVFWRVQSGPVDLDWAAPAVRAAANAAVFNGAVNRIEKVSLRTADDRGGYRLNLVNVRLGRRGAEASARLPVVDIAFYPKDFFSGKAGPRRVLIDGAELRILRRADRKLRLDFGEATGERARVFQSLTGGAYFREGFERAELRNATIAFVDEASGRTWVGRDGAAEVSRTKSGYTANLASRFDIGGKAASLSFKSDYNLTTDIISSRLSLTDAPVGDLVAVLFDANAELLTSPVSGKARIELTSDGSVLSSQIDLRAGGGVLTLGGWSTSIRKFAASAEFDPQSNEFTVSRAEWDGALGHGAVEGKVTLDTAKSGRGVSRVNFALAGEELLLIEPKFFPEPLPIGRASAQGYYDVKAKVLDLAALSAAFLGVDLSGRLSVAAQTDAFPAITAQAEIAGALDPPTLLKAWPKNLAISARDFVATRMPRATFSGVDFTMDLKAGAVSADGGLPDEAMTLSFRADGAEVIYAPTMTPLTNVSGRGVLGGNSFRFDADKGSLGKIRISDGEVDIPVLMPKGEPAVFKINAAGDARDIIGVLAQQPIAALAETKLTPQQFSGPALVKVEIIRPNLREADREDYRYQGVATFENLGVDGIIGDATLSGGKGRVDLDTDGMVITGDARVGDAPVAIEWRQRFAGAGDKTVITVKGEASSATGDLFGVPTRQYIQGAVPFTATATGGVDAFRALAFEADFTKAALVAEALGWMKPQGAPAKGSASFAFSPEGTKISALSLTGEGVAIGGSAAFAPGGALEAFDIPTFALEGVADLAMTARRDETGALALTATGKYLNGAEIIRDLIDNGVGGSGGAAPLALTARLDRIDFRAGASFRDASLEFRRDADQIDALAFSAITSERRSIAIELKQSGDGDAGEQAIEARSDDIGELLAGMFGLTSVKGGRGRLDFVFTPGTPDAPRKGTLEAQDLRVVKAPLLAKIFAVGSLTGLSDIMNGEGIELDDAYAAFAIRDGVVHISEARATGPAVGITGQGEVALEGDRELKLSGAVAPAYQFNSFLGKAPVIGDLFVNRKGEGLLALSYDVDGPAGGPRVTVNPLSALAPGVFRRMFEGGRLEAEPPPAE